MKILSGPPIQQKIKVSISSVPVALYGGFIKMCITVDDK